MVTNLFWSTQHRLCVVHKVCSIKSIYQCLALFMQATLWMTSELVLQVLALLKHFSQPDSSLFFASFESSAVKSISQDAFSSLFDILFTLLSLPVFENHCTSLLSMRLQSEEPHSCLEFYYTESCLGNFHPSIHFLNCASRLPVIGGEVGYNLDRLLVYHRTNTDKKKTRASLESPGNLTCMSLDSGRKL